ncbi:hypothetical protein FG379_003387 [Cryptosporidium bovis]|uniref:uncharacterized protein n=1 Tax=Cryptosporidium bovis TaxID=310047 RepID=UPI00351A6508|nr:hypothetical protein FG379_003387 [Cryptosporidium bovis]
MGRRLQKRVEKLRERHIKMLTFPSGSGAIGLFLLTLFICELFEHTSSQYIRVPVETCPESFSLTNGVCTHTIETQKIPICPEGYVSKGDECYSAEPILKDCPTGFIMQDKQCVMEVFGEKEITCPSGLVLDPESGKCLYKEEVGPVCPPGSVHLGEGCAITREPLKACPEPLIYDTPSELCLERNVTSPFVNCPDYFVFDSEAGICVKEDIDKLECPDGFDEIGSDKCGKWIYPERSCPKDSQIQTITVPGTGTLCKLTTYVNSTLVCPPDSWLEGDICVSDKSISDRVCPPGYVETQNKCIKYQDPVFSCPNGLEEFIQNGVKVCLSTVSVDPEITCPKIGSYFDENTRLCIFETIIEKECPEDSFSRGGSCFQKIQGNWDCPPGSKYDRETHSCLETLTIKPTMVCPANTRLDEYTSTCIGYVSNVKVCPPGYEEMGDDECATFLPPKRSCPDNLILTDQQCEETTLESPKTICPPGSELMGSICTMNSNNGVKKKCPQNSYDSGDYCSIYESPEKHCLEGYNLNNETGKCTKLISRPAEAFCSEPSAFMDNNECIKVENLQKTCPIGFDEDPTNQNLCIKERNPRIICPDGYILKNESCTKESKVKVELACPTGYRLDESDNNCHKIERKTKICPPGFLDNGDECFRTSNPVSICPKGYSKENKFGDCVELRITDPEAKCPEGSFRNGSSCIIKKPLPLEYKCLKGNRVGDSCVSEVFLPAVYECPHGYSLSEIKQCQKIVEYDCSEVNVIQVPCGKYGFMNTDVLNYPNGGGTYGTCSEVVRNPKTCSRTEAVPAKVTCPIGTVNIGKECLRKEHTKMTRVCSDHSKDPENCFQIVEVQKVDTCPGNSSKTEDGKCVLLVRLPPKLECPEGYLMEDGNCVQRARKHCPPEGCTINNIIESSPECPNGYEIENEVCIFKHTIEPTRICDEGQNYLNPDKGHLCHEKTLKTCPGNNCERIHRQPLEYKCDPGERLSFGTKQCENTVTGPKILKCEKPFKLVGDQCIHDIPKECATGNCSITISILPKYKCESGTLISNDKCEVIKRRPANLSCPNDYSLNNDMCVKYVFKECLNNQCEKKVSYFPTIDCPDQYEQLPNGTCEKKINHLPHLACPQGCDLFNSYCLREIEPVCPVEGCYAKETFIPNVKCPHGFEKNYRNFAFGSDAVCYKKLFKEGETSCPSGSIYSNGSCQMYSEKQCLDENCGKAMTLTPERICPNGMELLPNGLCKALETLPMEMYCPEEFQLKGDRCVQYKEKSCKRKNCIVRKVAEPLLSCQKGSRLEETVCVRDKFIPTTNSCPENHKMINGRCLHLFKKECPNGTCERNVYVEPTLHCPKGFVDVGNKCIYLEYSGHKKTCPPGSFMKKTHCIRFSKPEFRCPEVS